MEEKPKKKRVLLLSLFFVCAFIFLLGFLFYRNARQEEYTLSEDSSHKHVIKDVTISAKTPDFVKGWNELVENVDSFTARTKEEFKELPEKVKKPSKETENIEEGKSEETEREEGRKKAAASEEKSDVKMSEE